ncbi:carbohydrate ABC transporter permease [Aestuariivirga sp.]|jgi:multiple sugar transport system permease protein|uniref:carbohydrate ABC transporter permease n=1 Tax=Aestuariivirga sp. TaxID=2650926 RepID=UPI0037831A0B
MADVASRTIDDARPVERGWFDALRGDVRTWVFLIPAVVFFVGYQAYPIVRVLWISFTDYQYLSNEAANWIGFDNYIAALNDPLMWVSLWRATLFTLMFLPGCIILPLILAILIDRVSNPVLATVYRVILLIPAVIPSTLVFVLWKWMYNYQSGPINHFLVNTMGWFTIQDAPQWLGGTALTLPAIAVMEVWWGLGYHTIFFLAGLAAIPKDLPEAARIDGANEWQMFWHVTFPRLMPIMMILVVLRFGSAMAVIDEYLIFGGFNRDSPTYTWTVFMYDQAFKLGLWRQGFAAAIGMIGAVAMMIVMIILLRIFRTRG